MKKIINLSLLFILSSIYLNVNASISWSGTSGMINCSSQEIPSGTLFRAASTSGSSTCNGYGYLPSTYNTTTPVSGTMTSCTNNRRATTGSNSTTLVCQRWDNTSPQIDSNNNNNGNWFNPSIIGYSNITISFRDVGFEASSSQGTLRQVRYSWNTPLSSDCLSGGIVISNNLSGTFSSSTFQNHNIPFHPSDGEHQLYLCATDWAGNTTLTSKTYRIDRTPPLPSDISGFGFEKNNTYMIANTSEDFSITVDSAGGAPITSIQGRFERANTPANTSNILTNGELVTSSSSILTLNRDIRSVDNQRTINNYREYIFRVTQVCDSAGNCMTSGNLPTYSYNVYANYINSTNSFSSGTNQFISGNIADGSDRTISFTLRDQYGNRVLPVRQSNGINVVRSLIFTMNYNNDLYLNQYNRIGDSGVDFTTVDGTWYAPGNIGNSQSAITLINDVNNNNGSYNYNFRVYSPTYNGLESNGQQYAYGNFLINSINVLLSDTIVPANLSNSINFEFRPPYITNITGDIFNDGIIVGTTQSGNINVTSSGTKNVLLEYGYYDELNNNHSQHTNLSLRYKTTSDGDWYDVVSGRQSSHNFLTNFGTSSNNFITNIVQDGTLSSAEENTYIATHIRHTLFGKVVIYSSHIYGMNRYYGNILGDNTYQRGVKIEGLTHSQKQEEIISGQEGTDYSILGNLEKSILQRDIRRNAYSLVREVEPDNGTLVINNIDQNSPGVKLGNVLYFGNLGGSTVTLNTLASSTYTGVKTILIEGGNLYIRSNILANNKLEDILGIIVLKDINGNGGHIFIDNDVTEINAILYADKAIASSDQFSIINSSDLDKILSPENGGTYSNLNKQLYIYGSVFSNNTIGGSVESPYLCPYFITSLCTLDISQKYDMNYLRRGYVEKNNNSYEDYPTIIRYNPLIQLTPPPLFSR